MTDEEIIRLFFERSEQAIAELAKAHGSAAASTMLRKRFFFMRTILSGPSCIVPGA